MDAKADPPAVDDSAACAEGRALFATKLTYLEARIAAESSQRDAARCFEAATRASAGERDGFYAEDAPRTCSVEVGERLKRIGKHAAATQAMFGSMASAYEAVAPNLTTGQRDVLSRDIVPPPPFSPGPAGQEPPPHPGDAALICGEGAPGLRGPASPWGIRPSSLSVAGPFCQIEG
jgi:hypothetical protein